MTCIVRLSHPCGETASTSVQLAAMTGSTAKERAPKVNCGLSYAPAASAASEATKTPSEPS